jgi:DtxR family Mn-dependent transcriptional regulator
MADQKANILLTPALEDYLETVYRLISKGSFARVRDIADSRGVRPASVIPALRRLEKMGLIEYERREYVGLTKSGEETARRIYSRHQILRRFFEDFLGLPAEVAENDACAAEHSLSSQTADRLVRLIEFIEVCPDAEGLIARFQECDLVNPEQGNCDHHCQAVEQRTPGDHRANLTDLKPGQRGHVVQIDGQGQLRQRLLDMGFLSGVSVRISRIEENTSKRWVDIQGFELALEKEEALAVLVEIN